MAGQDVFKHAVVKLAETGAAALAKAGLGTADIDWLVPHQANLRIMAMTAHKLGVPMERVVLDGRQNLRPGGAVAERSADAASAPRRAASGATGGAGSSASGMVTGAAAMAEAK